MNDKIYEFATRAGLITFESIHDSMAVTPSIESVAKARKFAELIVKECARLADNSPQYIDGREILEHFGVEE